MAIVDLVLRGGKIVQISDELDCDDPIIDLYETIMRRYRKAQATLRDKRKIDRPDEHRKTMELSLSFLTQTLQSYTSFIR